MHSENYAKYKSVESAACFSFNILVRKIKKKLIEDNPTDSREEINDKISKNLKIFELNGQNFDFLCQETYLKGFRWYVKCPKCGKLCYKLYLPRKDSDKEQLYLCIDCHKLKNISSLLGTSKKYIKVYKPLKKLEKIRALLLKRSITPQKAKPLLDTYERIEKELSSSPEYRLWKFQKEHSKKSEGLNIQDTNQNKNTDQD